MDFILKVANKTVFWKKDHCTPGVMYNTGLTINQEETPGIESNIRYDKPMYEKELDSPLWDPDQNNVWIVMNPNEGSLVETQEQKDEFNKEYGSYVISFPVNGAIPKMIAFDVDKKWKPERVSIEGPEDEWWTEKYVPTENQNQ